MIQSNRASETTALKTFAGLTEHQRKADGKKPDGPQFGQPLTRREREVLDLRAEGLTGAEVATRLFIAPRTVGYHSANAYVKLGVHNLLAAMQVLHRLDAKPLD